MSVEHRLVTLYLHGAVCTCGYIGQANHDLGGYGGDDGLHFIPFAVVAGRGGACANEDVADDVCGLPYEAHGAGMHRFETVAGYAELPTRPTSRPADDPDDAPEPPRERVAPLPMMQPSSVPVDDAQAARDAHNATARAKRLREFHLRVQAGHRGRGPVPRGL